ncbi:MAG: GNAT family N-acetyltransferase [Rubrivivax sp.]
MPRQPEVTIRQIERGDEPAFVQAARRSRRLHGRWVTAPTDGPAFGRYLARFELPASFGFVVLAPGGELAGAVNLTNVVQGNFRSGYLGYFAFAGHERRGMMRSALPALIRHAFGPLRLHRVEANIQPENTASIALARACGLQREGFSPAYLKLGGRWRDHERWALVRPARS